MFGKKQGEINNLRRRLQDTEIARGTALDASRILQKRVEEYSKELDMALETITGYENRVKSLDEELARFHDVNVAFADENRDLSQRLNLLQDVFRQLQIPVKLPARKR